MVVLKELIFNSFLSLGGCVGLERYLIFNWFLHREGVVMLKELFLIVSTLGLNGGLIGNHF